MENLVFLSMERWFDFISEFSLTLLWFYFIGVHYYFMWNTRDGMFEILENMFPSFYKRNKSNIKWIYSHQFMFMFSLSIGLLLVFPELLPYIITLFTE